MIKRVFLWTLYFVVCAAVITAAIRGGMHHEYCPECHQAYRLPVDSNKFVFHVYKGTDTGDK